MILGDDIEHARSTYHKTCGTEYQQPYRRWISSTPYYNWNIAQARPLRVSGVSRKLSKLSFNHSSVVLTADVFNFFKEINKPLESALRGRPGDRKFSWCNNGDILVCHTRCESSSP